MKGGGASRASPLFSVRDTHQFPRQGPARELPLVSAKTRQLRPLARPPQPAAYVADGRCTCSSTIGRERALRLRSALLLSRPTRKDLERNQPLVWVQLANPWQWHPLTPDYGPDHATAGHHQVTRADDDLCVPRAELRANCTGSQTTTKPPMFCQHGWEDERATAGSAAAVVMHTPAMHAAGHGRVSRGRGDAHASHARRGSKTDRSYPHDHLVSLGHPRGNQRASARPQPT